jgi:lysophospholipase L1-like esterase
MIYVLLICSVAASAQVQPLAVKPASTDSVAWYRVADWGVEGQAWSDVARTYDRLPRRAEGIVREKVWELSRQSAGMSCRFVTDAQEIRVRYVLLSQRIALAHMPATGVSGVDLYVHLDQAGWRWIATSQPATQQVQATLIREMSPGRREYMMYLPLLNGIDSLEIGVPPGSSFAAVSPRRDRPLVFYGTSIMHGACASRAGMAIPAILGRWLDVPTVNLGFNGNGKMEPEVGKFLTEIDASVYIIDCLPNLTALETAQRTIPLVRQIRAARPGTPILLVEDRIFPNSVVLPGRAKGHTERQAALHAAYDSLLAEGVKGLHYLTGAGLLGDDGEATVDGSHPTDLGMKRYADAYERALRPILRLQ